MIFFNGATGSLGQMFAPALAAAGREGVRLDARLEDREGLRCELEAHAERARGRAVWLVQMAAKVSVPACEADPAAAHKTNVEDTLATVGEFAAWAELHGSTPHVWYVSSGHVYASAPHGTRLRETDPLEPRSVYARTKLAAERALAEHAQQRGYALRIGRVFGLLAPRQPANYMLPGLIRRVRERALAGVPGLSFYRDFLDARDVCRVLVALCRTPVPNPLVNICSGDPVQLRVLVERLAQLIAPAEAETLLSQLVEAPGRADDVPFIAGDPSLLERELCGPARSITLEQTLRDTIAERR